MKLTQRQVSLQGNLLALLIAHSNRCGRFADDSHAPQIPLNPELFR